MYKRKHWIFEISKGDSYPPKMVPVIVIQEGGKYHKCNAYWNGTTWIRTYTGKELKEIEHIVGWYSYSYH